MADLTRRQVARTAAWSVPVVAIGAAAPAASASTTGQSCPGEFAGPVGSWLSSTGFTSYGAWEAGAAWYVDIDLVFHSKGCGFGADYDVETSVESVVAHYEQGGSTGTISPLAYCGLNGFADLGVCADKLTMGMGGVGEDDLFVTKVEFVYLISGLPDGTSAPCTVPVTATLTYPDGAKGNDAKGTVTIA